MLDSHFTIHMHHIHKLFCYPTMDCISRNVFDRAHQTLAHRYHEKTVIEVSSFFHTCIYISMMFRFLARFPITHSVSPERKKWSGALRSFIETEGFHKTTVDHDAICNVRMLNMTSICKRTMNRIHYKSIHSLFSRLNSPRIHFRLSHHVRIAVIHFTLTCGAPADIHMFSLNRIFICAISKQL
jgi:hypothetical protein